MKLSERGATETSRARSPSTIPVLCENHRERIVSFCLSKQCKAAPLCSSCILDHINQQHKDDSSKTAVKETINLQNMDTVRNQAISKLSKSIPKFISLGKEVDGFMLSNGVSKTFQTSLQQMETFKNELIAAFEEKFNEFEQQYKNFHDHQIVNINKKVQSLKTRISDKIEELNSLNEGITQPNQDVIKCLRLCNQQCFDMDLEQKKNIYVKLQLEGSHINHPHDNANKLISSFTENLEKILNQRFPHNTANTSLVSPYLNSGHSSARDRDDSADSQSSLSYRPNTEKTPPKVGIHQELVHSSMSGKYTSPKEQKQIMQGNSRFYSPPPYNPSRDNAQTRSQESFMKKESKDAEFSFLKLPPKNPQLRSNDNLDHSSLTGQAASEPYHTKKPSESTSSPSGNIQKVPIAGKTSPGQQAANRTFTASAGLKSSNGKLLAMSPGQANTNGFSHLKQENQTPSPPDMKKTAIVGDKKKPQGSSYGIYTVNTILNSGRPNSSSFEFTEKQFTSALDILCRNEAGGKRSVFMFSQDLTREISFMRSSISHKSSNAKVMKTFKSLLETNMLINNDSEAVMGFVYRDSQGEYFVSFLPAQLQKNSVCCYLAFNNEDKKAEKFKSVTAGLKTLVSLYLNEKPESVNLRLREIRYIIMGEKPSQSMIRLCILAHLQELKQSSLEVKGRFLEQAELMSLRERLGKDI